MRQLWLPTFYNATDYPWATDFITVLRGVFGPGYNLEVIDGPTIKSMVAESKKHVICFRKVVLEDGRWDIDSPRSLSLQRRRRLHQRLDPRRSAACSVLQVCGRAAEDAAQDGRVPAALDAAKGQSTLPGPRDNREAAQFVVRRTLACRDFRNELLDVVSNPHLF